MPLFIDSPALAPAIELNAPNCISIGLINNMPDAALAATERQFTDLIRAATPNVVVLLKLFAMPDLPRGEGACRMLAERYRDIAALWDSSLDGLIVTGTEPRAANLIDEPYWESLSQVVDWAREHTSSTIWSCLAAHAAVLHADGIERRALKEKRCGIFDCRLVADHPMTEHFPEPLWVPHSRYNDLPEEALTACGYKILTRSEAAGVDTFAKQDGSFFLFFQGHPEYEADTLLREYRRDVGRFLDHERAHYPELPLGYFSPDGAAAAKAFRLQALAQRRAALAAEFPTAALEASLQCPWRPAALGVYEKWCAFLHARKAERRSSAPRALRVRPRRTWRDWPLGTRGMADTPVR
ncbi:MAG TPA: homoserine O-succinyltransferase [Xanthobacteraceae bacterium]|jgi:homoserine O-succinyltransferase|nr:homoserine O-succinyltransferase [Xanthobacteraceae bacterium]